MSANVNNAPLQIEVWIDPVCPFCYMGERRLKAGIELEGGPTEIIYRSYQLRPDLPPDADLNFIEMFAERRGISLEQTREMMVGPIADGRALGLDLNFEHARPTNTRRAHELLHFARSKGKADEMLERVFKAYFTEGKWIADPETLADLAADVGLDGNEAARALKDGRFSAQVDADIAAARRAGVSSVPHFVIDGRMVIVGGQPPEIFAKALRQARMTQA